MAPTALSLFPGTTPSSTGTITAHCDGGARGNPGPAGFGAQITDADGNVLAELSEFLGFRTNNYAEYSGLLASLQYALDHNYRSLKVISDSELMVKQIQGRYKVNSPDLKPLWQEAKHRIAKLDRFEIAHALRHKNKDADRLANEAMDRGMKRGAPAVPSLPLRAIAYPDQATAPPAPTSLDPSTSSRQKPPSSRPKPPQSQDAVEKPLQSTPVDAHATPAMLRGFARAGVVHILGPHTLPDGTFVKIIPE